MRFLCWTCLLGLFVSTVPGADAVSLEETRQLTAQWLRQSGQFKTLEIDFVQERQLRALRQPLSKQGKLWVARDGRLRWQIDEPPALLLVRAGQDAPLLWIDFKKQSWRQLRPEDDASQGNAQAMQMLLQSQGADLATFEAAFTLRAARPVDSAEGRWRLELDLKDRRASLAVKDVFFEIEPRTGALHLMEFQLRDGSLLRTRVTRVVKNPALAAVLFQPELSGLSKAP